MTPKLPPLNAQAGIAFGLWAYSSLDAIDGKQARRTGTSGPLGEFFDHGCDAVNLVLTTFLCAAIFNFTLDFLFLVNFSAAILVFFTSTIEEYFTGTLFLGIVSGPVEGLIVTIAGSLITYKYGQDFWDTPLGSLTSLAPFLNDLLLKTLFLYSGIGLVFVSLLMSWGNIKEEQKMKFTIQWSKFLIFFISIVSCAYFHHDIMGDYSIYYILMTGFSFAHIVASIIVAHLTKTNLPGFPMSAWFIIISSGCSAIAKFLSYDLNLSSLPHLNVFAGFVCASTILLYFRFVISVIQDICSALNINCLTIKRKPKVK